MRVYESCIEICMQRAMQKFEQRSEEQVRQLRALRKLIPVTRGELCDETTQASALVDLLWSRACVQTVHAGNNGYVGAFHNCAFDLLFGVFGADIIGYLFDRAWVPSVKIDPIRPELFLERLSVLERAAAELKEGSETPVRLPETVPYLRLGMGPVLSRFSEQQHRLLLKYSLCELRDFGELGLSLQQHGENQTVSIHIYALYEDHDPEIMAFAAGSRDTRGN